MSSHCCLSGSLLENVDRRQEQTVQEGRQQELGQTHPLPAWQRGPISGAGRTQAEAEGRGLMVRLLASGEQGSRSREETWQQAQDLVFGKGRSSNHQRDWGWDGCGSSLLMPQREDSKRRRALSSC